MKQQPPDASGIALERCTCTACPLLCDDILITADGLEPACDHGRTSIRAALTAAQATHDSAGPPDQAWESGTLLSRGEAIERAATMLAAARRVLVTGLASATLEAVAAACDLAEALGAVVDAGLPESARVAGPTIARAGEVTGVWEELRDRADLVIFWCCDPVRSHPRFIERFVAPTLADGRHRRTIAIGPDRVMPDASTHCHLPLDGDLAVEAARVLQMRLAGRHVTPADTPLSAACAAVEQAIHTACCVAIVTTEGADRVGLQAWSIVHLIRTVAHEKPAFQIPLGTGLASSGANVAGAAAACTWRYGAAGAIARADRMGGLFLPAEADAQRLIDRGEVDAVLVLGRLNRPLEQSIAGRGDALSLVRISDGSEAMPQGAVRTVQLRCASGLTATSGTMLREDGRRVELVSHQQSLLPQMREVLVDLAGALRLSPGASSSGGRP